MRSNSNRASKTTANRTTNGLFSSQKSTNGSTPEFPLAEMNKDFTAQLAEKQESLHVAIDEHFSALRSLMARQVLATIENPATPMDRGWLSRKFRHLFSETLSRESPTRNGTNGSTLSPVNGLVYETLENGDEEGDNSDIQATFNGVEGELSVNEVNQLVYHSDLLEIALESPDSGPVLPSETLGLSSEDGLSFYVSDSNELMNETGAEEEEEEESKPVKRTRYQLQLDPSSLEASDRLSLENGTVKREPTDDGRFREILSEEDLSNLVNSERDHECKASSVNYSLNQAKQVAPPPSARSQRVRLTFHNQAAKRKITQSQEETSRQASSSKGQQAKSSEKTQYSQRQTRAQAPDFYHEQQAQLQALYEQEYQKRRQQKAGPSGVSPTRGITSSRASSRPQGPSDGRPVRKAALECRALNAPLQNQQPQPNLLPQAKANASNASQSPGRRRRRGHQPQALPDPTSGSSPWYNPAKPFMCTWEEANGQMCGFHSKIAGNLRFHIREKHLGVPRTIKEQIARSRHEPVPADNFLVDTRKLKK